MDEEPEDPGGGAEEKPDPAGDKAGVVGQSLDRSAHGRELTGVKRGQIYFRFPVDPEK
jgi:hypothetical protein